MMEYVIDNKNGFHKEVVSWYKIYVARINIIDASDDLVL